MSVALSVASVSPAFCASPLPHCVRLTFHGASLDKLHVRTRARARARTGGVGSGIRAAHSGDFAAAVAAAATLTLASGTPVVAPPVATPVAAHVHVVRQEAGAPDAALVLMHSRDVAVTGVGKSAIHDFARDEPRLAQTQAHTAVRTDHRGNGDEDDARREFVLAARLVTAVMMGVMLGVERRATMLNLGVRSLTVISVSAALAGVFATCVEHMLVVPARVAPIIAMFGGAPACAAIVVTAVAALAVFLGGRARPRQVRFLGNMSVVIGMAVGMGLCCGAGLPILTAALYLGAVCVMRGERGAVKVPAHDRRPVDDGREGSVVEALRRTEH